MSNECEVCHLPASQRCSQCQNVFYCTREHQKQHWSAHKTKCRSLLYEVRHSDQLGRYLVAAVDLKPGDVIFKDRPMILGPKVVSLPLCLGCHLHLITGYRCSGCHWPMCGPKCEKSSNHVAECNLMREKNYKANIAGGDKKESAYCCITPLRCLLLKTSDPGKWKTFMKFESHLEERRTTPLYLIFQKNVVGFVKNALRLDVDEELILKVCAILDTNSFEVRRSDGQVKMRGLYPTAALMSHDCSPNTKHAFNEDDSNNYSIIVTATRPIKRGDIISTTYTQTLWATSARRAHLRASKCFDCTCHRCKDPTELGTYLGSFICVECKEGKVISTSPLDLKALWKCESCGKSVAAEDVAKENNVLQKEIATMEKVPNLLEEFLNKHGDKLHSTNTHVIEIKYALALIYGNRSGYTLSELPEKLLKKKIELCQDLLKVSDILDPGVSRLRGLLLLDLQAAIQVQASYVLDMADAKIRLGKAMKTLQEAAEILQSEPGMEETLKEKIKCLNYELK